MKLTSHGAAEEVTGSKHLIEVNGKRVLLDCGMFQGHRVESDRKNRDLGFDPASLDAVILSHAHIDHSGLLPLLGKRGYTKAIYSTPATRDLCAIMLLDSAHIQQRDAEWLAKKKMEFVPPVYDSDDVQHIMRQFISIPYEFSFDILPGLRMTFHEAGHVLGSAMVDLRYEEDGAERRFLYTGDIGRKGMYILKDPWEPTEADAVLMESTYGNRDHDPIARMEDHLAEIIHETLDRGGKIIVPSFALERAQEMIYALKRLELRDAIPEIPVYVDSPLTVNVTDVFRLHTEAFDDEFRKLLRETGDPFQLRRIRYIRSAQESMQLNDKKEPAIIISAAGMCEHGRILHHIKNNCEDPRNTILIIGFQAKHTLGRRIEDRERTIRVLGVQRELNAKVRVMNEFSAHAGRTELLDFAGRLTERAEKFLLAHGEPPEQQSLKQGLKELGAREVIVQRQGKTVTV